MVPMTTRGAKKNEDVGNQIGMSAMPIRTDIADPIERVLAVRRSSNKTKQATESIGKDLPGKLLNLLPAAAGKMLIMQGLLPRANLTISNVRGPDVPLYLAGAKMVLFLPVSIPMDNLGLNITGFSYNGTLWICAVACRQMMPDPATFAQCYRDNFDALLLASKKLPDPSPAPAAGSVSRTARKPSVRAVAKPAEAKAPAKTSTSRRTQPAATAQAAPKPAAPAGTASKPKPVGLAAAKPARAPVSKSSLQPPANRPPLKKVERPAKTTEKGKKSTSKKSGKTVKSK
jgi:hypothetical protein